MSYTFKQKYGHDHRKVKKYGHNYDLDQYHDNCHDISLVTRTLASALVKSRV